MVEVTSITNYEPSVQTPEHIMMTISSCGREKKRRIYKITKFLYVLSVQFHRFKTYWCFDIFKRYLYFDRDSKTAGGTAWASCSLPNFMHDSHNCTVLSPVLHHNAMQISWTAHAHAHTHSITHCRNGLHLQLLSLHFNKRCLFSYGPKITWQTYFQEQST